MRIRGLVVALVMCAGLLAQAPTVCAQSSGAAQLEHQPPKPAHDAGVDDDAPLLVAPTGAEPVTAPPAERVSARGDGQEGVRYFLERVKIKGNDTTLSSVISRFVPLKRGDVLNVDAPEIETLRWELLGTGWFSDVTLRLEKGSQRGWVVLVIEVKERNTFVLQQIAFGVAQGVDRSSDTSNNVEPYFGATIAETNLLGTGKTLALSGLISERQQGVRLRFTDPIFLGSEYLASALLFFNSGREFFGDDPQVSIRCPPMLQPDDECPREVQARSAVVLYKRYGLGFGTGHDLGVSTRFTLDWQGEFVDVATLPDAASELRGDDIVPIDFHINRGVSFVSALRFGITYDRRDDPGLPTSGALIRFQGDLSADVIGSDYRYLKLQVLGRAWQRLPWANHYVRFGVFAGFVSGDAPFFQRFYASDLSDLIPGRQLEMNVDNRQPPNLLGTSVSEFRTGDLAGRIDVEYGIPFYRGDGFFRRVDGYFGGGLYGLVDSKGQDVAVSGYSGVARIPLDLTFDFGLRADTTIGVLQFGFSNLLGFFVL